MFISYLLSQRIEGRVISPVERSIAYFLSYGLGFSLTTDFHSVIKTKTDPNLVEAFYLVCVLPIMIFQTIRFMREAISQRFRVWILICFVFVVVGLMVIYSRSHPITLFMTRGSLQAGGCENATC